MSNIDLIYFTGTSFQCTVSEQSLIRSKSNIAHSTNMMWSPEWLPCFSGVRVSIAVVRNIVMARSLGSRAWHALLTLLLAGLAYSDSSVTYVYMVLLIVVLLRSS